MRQLTRRQRISAVILAAVALCFVTLDLGGGSLSTAHAGVRGTLGSLYRGTDALLGPVRRWAQGVPTAGTNTGRIQQLQRDNAALQRQVDALRVDRATTGELARLQRAADGSALSVLAARVVALGPGGGFDWTVTVDAGSRSGVQVGQTVTDGAGLVGRVLHADADSSVVLLAADPGSGVGVRDAGNGEIGVVTGQGARGFSFTPLRPDATIKVGDQLITGPSGSTSYVPGVAVGTVSTVRVGADGTVRAAVTPTASPTAVDVVGIVLGGTRAGLAAGAPLTPRAPR